MPLKSVGMLPQRARCPVILLLDTSGSMGWSTPSGQTPIDELNKGLAVLKQAVEEDEVAARRVDVAMVTFGPVRLLQNFVTIAQFVPSELEADDVTPMGEAIEYALNLAESRKAYYKQQGIPYYQPLVFMITDGEPDYGENDGKAPALEKALEIAQQLKELDKNEKITFFSIAVQNADRGILEQITPPKRPNEEIERVKKLNGLEFSELFKWISDTVGRVSRSRPGQQVKFAPTSAWSEEN